MSGKIYNLQIPNTLRKKIITTSLTRQKSRKKKNESKCEIANQIIDLSPNISIIIIDEYGLKDR